MKRFFLIFTLYNFIAFKITGNPVKKFYEIYLIIFKLDHFMAENNFFRCH